MRIVTKVLAVLRPNAEWALDGDSYDDLVWLDQVEAKPTREEFEAAVAADLPAHVTAVTPRQARLALYVFGLLDQVEAAVEAAGGSTKISWEFATEINRNDPLVVSLGAALNISSEQLDALFDLAVTL